MVGMFLVYQCPTRRDNTNLSYQIRLHQALVRETAGRLKINVTQWAYSSDKFFSFMRLTV